MHDSMERLERLGRRRAFLAILLGAAFVATQVSGKGGFLAGKPVFVAIWLAWAAAMLVFILAGYGFGANPGLHDEGTAANRRAALVAGFWTMLIASAVVFGRTFYEPVEAREAVYTVVTLGLGLAIVEFGRLEWKDHHA